MTSASVTNRDDWPHHAPIAPDAPIPGRNWFSGCEPGGDWDSETGRYTGTGPRVSPAGICESCGETACPVCGAGFYPDGGCQCGNTKHVCDHFCLRPRTTATSLPCLRRFVSWLSPLLDDGGTDPEEFIAYVRAACIADGYDPTEAEMYQASLDVLDAIRRDEKRDAAMHHARTLLDEFKV